MEARLTGVVAILIAPALLGAGYPTDNFVVTAPTPEIARQVGEAAEHYRRQLAIEWLGHELPRWYTRCPVYVNVGQIGAGGATTFSFYPNGQGSAEVSNWDMRIQGSLERILDSVLPHEVSHTIFACHFRRPLPRWADEGAATLAEHESERRRQALTVRQVVDGRRRIPLRNLLGMKEYPTDPQDVLTLYAEGYALADLLVQEGGREKYLRFLGDAHRDGWEKAIRVHYGYRGVDDLERRWHDWIVAGSPEIAKPKDQELASNRKKQGPEKGAPVLRAQSPSEDPFIDEPVAAVESAPRRATGFAAPAPRERPRRKPGARDRQPAVERNQREAGQRELLEVRNEAAADVSADDSRPHGNSMNVELAANQRHRGAEVKFAGQRNDQFDAAARRQVTEWSEFPQDPRPSPFRLPGGNRSGARP